MTGSDDRKRVRLAVSGRVQGVYFRASTRERAEALGLVGWVRNTAGGGVVAEVQGPPEAVDALVAWARRGPPAARVDAVEVEAISPVAGESGFSVRW